MKGDLLLRVKETYLARKIHFPEFSPVQGRALASAIKWLSSIDESGCGCACGAGMLNHPFWDFYHNNSQIWEPMEHSETFSAAIGGQ